MIEHHERFHIPDQLVSLVGKIAELYSPFNAIDPCCEDVALLRECHFVKERHAIFRNPSSLREASQQTDNIHLELGDITRISLNKLYDLVVTFLPFGARDVVDGRSRRLDLLVAERCLDIVSLNGVCLILAPQYFLSATFLSEFRRRVLDGMALDATIEFPPGTLDRTTSLPGALLVVRNGPPRRFGTYMGTFDGQTCDEWLVAIRDGIGSFFVRPEGLRERWDRHFHDPRHQKTESELNSLETRRLEEFGEIRRGRPDVQRLASDRGEFLVLRSGSQLRGNRVVTSDRDRYLDTVDEPWFADSLIQPGDVVVSLMQPVAYVYKATDPPAVLGVNVARIRARDNDYVATYLNTPDGQALFAAQADRQSRGTAINTLAVSDLRNIRIPILPLEDLNSMSDAAIESASPPELETLRQKLGSVKLKLETAEAELARERQRGSTTNEETLKKLRFIASQNAKILEQQQATNAKLDQIVYVLASMRGDIGTIKQSSRDDEEKLARICARLDTFTAAAAAETRTIQEYVEVVQTWLDRWDTLDDLTKKFLPSAEQLYDLLENQPDADFSPFVIQYCRAFENEILTKLFSAYHDDFAKRVTDATTFVAADLQLDNTKRFAKSVRNDVRRYTLGDMNFIMQLLKPGGETLSQSPLLQDFRNFVVTYFDKRISEKHFLGQVQHINEEFRCKAAHPYLMTKAIADECLKIVRSALSELLDSYRTGTPPTP